MTFKPDLKTGKILYRCWISENIKTLLFSTLDELAIDLETDMFTNYPTWTTRYGATIHNINDALRFLPFHERLACGLYYVVEESGGEVKAQHPSPHVIAITLFVNLRVHAILYHYFFA